MTADRPQWQRAIVIGASSGIGEALARLLARGGTAVALVARRDEELRRICAEINGELGRELARWYQHDVLDWPGVPELFQRITTDLGGLDLVIYASGVMPLIGGAEYPTDSDILTINTNLAGAVAWLNEAARRFDIAGGGTIIGTSSVAGDRGRHGLPVYNATKAALNSYLESLRNRLARRGVTVVTVKLGYVRTPLIEGVRTPVYLPAISAEVAAEGILSAAEMRTRVAYVPGWWKYFMLLIKSIPSPLLERLKI
jgi:decaprenylphospho-beta-D-erythro-pentofuranosid-2-ulose 2-reductase